MQINFNGFGFDPQQLNTVILEFQLGNQVVDRQQLPLVFAKQQFADMVRQVANDPRPIQIKCIYDDYTDEGKEIKNSLAFQNNVFIKNFN